MLRAILVSKLFTFVIFLPFLSSSPPSFFFSFLNLLFRPRDPEQPTELNRIYENVLSSFFSFLSCILNHRAIENRVEKRRFLLYRVILNERKKVQDFVRRTMKLSYFACIELNSSQRGGKKGGLDLSSAEKQQQQQQQS